MLLAINYSTDKILFVTNFSRSVSIMTCLEYLSLEIRSKSHVKKQSRKHKAPPSDEGGAFVVSVVWYVALRTE